MIHISWEGRPNLAFRKIEWTEQNGFVPQEPGLYYISDKTLVILNDDIFPMIGTALGASKPIRFHGPIMDTSIWKVGLNLTFESCMKHFYLTVLLGQTT